MRLLYLLAVVGTVLALDTPKRLVVLLDDPTPGLARADRETASRAIQDRFLYSAKRSGFALSESLLVGGHKREARYSSVLNAVAIDIPVGTDDVSGFVGRVKEFPGVVGAWPEETHVERLFTSGAQINLGSAWAKVLPHRAGEGVKIAVVDGGTHRDVAMMSGEGFEWPSDIPAPGLGETENCNGKIIVSKAYFNPKYPPAEGENHSWPGPLKDSHGVHTSSTAAGVPVNISVNGETVSISGMAPYAWVMNYRIFYVNTAGSSSAQTPEILAALEDAVADGADVISNSWGATTFQDSGSLISRFTTKATKENGVVFVYAAGNAGSYFTTMDHAEKESIRVGNAQTEKIVSLGIFTQPGWQPLFPTISSAKVAVLSSTENSGAFLELVVPPTAEATACTLSGNYTGKAILIASRTLGCTVQQKISAAANAGAVLALFKSSSESIATFTFTPDPRISVAHTGYTAGTMLAKLCSNYTVTMHIEKITEPSGLTDFMSSSSSRGPTADLTLGPDIVAPGSNIVAAGYGVGAGMQVHFGYGSASGTSMACPHVSGAAALVLQKNPNFSPAEVKSAIMTTSALDVFIGSNHASPLDAGAGRLDFARAVTPSLFFDPPAVDFSLRNVNKTHQFRVFVYAYKTLRNLSISIDSIVGSYAATSSMFSVSPSSIAHVRRSSFFFIDVSFNSPNVGDHMANLVVRTVNNTESEIVAHAPIWARAMTPKVADVFLIDLDGSACWNLTDYGDMYQKAFQEAGYNVTRFEPKCIKGFTYPADVFYGSYGTVAVITGYTAHKSFPDMSLRYADATALTNQGTAYVTMGPLQKSLYTSYDGNAPLVSTLCGSKFLESVKVSTAKSPVNTPAPFSGINVTLGTAVTTNVLSYDSSALQQIPLLTAETLNETRILAKAFVHQDVPKGDSFHSVCMISSVGLDLLPEDERTPFIGNMMALLHQNRPQRYSMQKFVMFNKAYVRVHLFDNDFDPSEILIVWGDNGDTIEHYEYTTERISYNITDRTKINPVVMVKSNLGRIFQLHHHSLINS